MISCTEAVWRDVEATPFSELDGMSAVIPKQEWQAGLCQVRLQWRHLSLAALARRAEVGMYDRNAPASNCTFRTSIRSVTSQGPSMTNARQSMAAQLNAGVAAWHAEEVDKARLARCLALVLAAELPHVTNLQLVTNR